MAVQTTEPTSATVASLFAPGDARSRVIVADGHGVRISVNRGHLLIHDGIGQHQRQRRIPRAQRTVRRIVVLATDGMVTLDATRWCADLRIPLLQIERSGRILMVSGANGPDDPRLRRAQACADPTGTRLSIALDLLGQKLAGQATVARHLLDSDDAAAVIEHTATKLPHADTVPRLLELEAAAASTYFSAWSGKVAVRFANRVRAKVPDHWHTFDVRKSILESGHSPRRASDPINALLNYAYGLAEVECRLALAAVGLDPGLGVLHADKKNRDSLAFDLLEPVRPYIDELVLTLLRDRRFGARDFYETRQGVCRLMPTITHELATWLTASARHIAPIAESLAHAFTDDVPGTVIPRTVLTKANSKKLYPTPARSRSRAAPGRPRLPATCRECGASLANQRGSICPACWPAEREKAAKAMVTAGTAELARRRIAGDDPSQTSRARARRSASLTRHRAEQAAWENANTTVLDLDYSQDIQPRLASVPLSVLRTATGLSTSACSRIRSGTLTPHRRHWVTLATAVADSAPDTGH
jgi:CRISPR-associated endonuclease Cas1